MGGEAVCLRPAPSTAAPTIWVCPRTTSLPTATPVVRVPTHGRRCKPPMRSTIQIRNMPTCVHVWRNTMRSSHGNATTQTTPAVYWPAQAYGDYARAARAWGLSSTDTAAQAQLIWLCEPSSPLGQSDADAPARVAQLREHQQLVLDLAYEPLRLSGQSLLLQSTAKDRVWQMWTPNKALGMTGVRAAYVIAPEGAQEAVDHLQALAPSWVMGAHGVALLHAWCEPSVQQWLLTARQTLREWKAQQITLCESFGWQVHASEANYFAARLPQPLQDEQCKALRSHGVKLRDATSFGLPDWVRVGVRSPASQAVLAQAWHNLGVSA